MATPKSAAPKKRDYSAERARTKLNKQKAAAGTDAQEDPEPARKAPQEAKAVQNIDPGQCGHIDVALSSIISDPNQPRKFFDAGKLLELSKTIVEHGVLEPILIRPIPGDLYMVVFGERRFRASLMAGEAGHPVTTIPAMIKEMTDAQALEVQLIENLHRTDPHPIEDAHTFKRMLDNHSIEEIALRIVKSTKFVAMRIMLCDLIQPFQEVFFANKMSLGQAVMLCKVSAEAQAEIFSDEVPDNWKEDDDFQLDDIEHMVKMELKNLDSAPFKTEDVDLYPDMGACGKCKFNSANNLVLFTDENTSRICGNAVCFNIKASRAYKHNIEEVLTDPSVVLVASHHYSESDKQKVKEVEKMGASVMKYGAWKPVPEQTPKPDWTEFFKDKVNGEDFDGCVPKEFEDECREEFNDELERWEEEENEIKTARAEGKVRKAFIVVGSSEGTFVEVMPASVQGEIGLKEGGGGVADEVTVQINEIKKREERAVELDAEKVWQQVRSVMLQGNHLDNDSKLSKAERGAMASAIYISIGWEEREAFSTQVLGLASADNDGMDCAAALHNISEQHFNVLCRLWMKKILFPLPGSHLANHVNAAGYSLAVQYMPKQVKDIEANQAAKAAKRAETVKKKIQDLKDPPPPKEKKGEE